MPNRRTNVALIVGGVLGLLPLGTESFEWLAIFSFPGLIFSAILSGNFHAFPLWLAAIGNFIFFYLLVRVIWLLIDLFRKTDSD
jgi:hypothetical protein